MQEQVGEGVAVLFIEGAELHVPVDDDRLVLLRLQIFEVIHRAVHLGVNGSVDPGDVRLRAFVPVQETGQIDHVADL